MKSRIRRPSFRLLAVFCALTVSFALLAVPVMATGVDLDAATPPIEIHIDLGTTPVTDAFLTELKSKLIALGLGSGKVKVTLTNSEQIDASDVTQWDVFDHIGDWEERAASLEDGYDDANGDYHEYDWDTDHYYYPNMDPDGDEDMSNDPHIIPSEDGATLYFYGYGEYGYSDFLLSKADVPDKKMILFTIDENNATYHSLAGSGFLFDAEIVDDALSAFALLVKEDDIVLVRIDAVDVETLHDNEDEDNLLDLEGVSVLDIFAKPDTMLHHFIVEVEGQTVSVRDNDEYLESVPENPLAYEAMGSAYDALGTDKMFYDYLWSKEEKSFVAYGSSTDTITVTGEEVVTAGGYLYGALVSKGSYSGWFDYSYDSDTDIYTVEVENIDCYPWYLVDAGTTIEDYGQAADYLTSKDIPYEYINQYNYVYLDRYTICPYAPYTYVRIPVMDEKVAEYAESGIDITDYDGSELDGTNLIWYYYDVDGNTQSVSFPLADLVPGLVSRTSEDYLLPATYGNRFGPICAYEDHGCSDLTAVVFSDLQMNVVKTRTTSLFETADDQTYEEGTLKFFVHAEDQLLEGLDISALGALFAADGVTYIGIGSAANATQQSAIASATGSGDAFLSTDDEFADSVASFIYGIVKAKIIENLLDTYPVETETTYDSGSATSEGLDSAVDILDDLLAGESVELKLTIATLALDEAPTDDRTLVEAYLGDLTQGEGFGYLLFDINLTKYLTMDGGTTETPITLTLKPISIRIVIPEAARGKAEYKVFRVHGGVVEELSTTYDPDTFTLTFATDKFSTYGVTFESMQNPETGDASKSLPLVFGVIGLLGLALTFYRRKVPNQA